MPCGSDDCTYRVVGTILHFDSALERLMNDPTWMTRRYAAHASYADFSHILWPEKFSEARLRALRDDYIAQGEADSYSCEYLNNPIAEGDAFFQRTNLLEMTEAQRRDILNGKLRLTYYAGWDFAVSQEQKRDYTVGSVWGVDQEGWNYKVDIRRGRWDTLEIVDEMFNVEKAYSPQTHFVEKGTIEKSILPFLNVEMKNRKRYIDLTALTSTTQKEVRAKPLQGITKQKHLIVDKELPEWPEMEEEYVRFPKGQHDDIVDSDSIIARGMQDIIPPDTDEEIYEDEMRKIVSTDDGRSRVTGY